MKSLGKTPSQYNHKRQATGFKDWTDWRATDRNIDAWAEEEDFGICIQTRRIRALDVDVPDQDLAVDIATAWGELLEDELGLEMGLRFRQGTGKRLLAFICAEPLSKRSFTVKEWQDPDTGKTKRWIVELLADGQQFVAAGQHTDGTRYEWAGGAIPAELPEFTLAQVDRAWARLVARFALPGSERRAERRSPTLLEDLDVDDPVAEHLVEAWETYGYDRGMLHVRCPNEDSHSSDNGETQTSWLLAGTGQYRNGHFRCMHAGCGHIDRKAFLEAVGFKPAKASDFEDLSQGQELVAAYVATSGGGSPKAKELKAEAQARGGLPLPIFNRTPQGLIEASLENVVAGLKAYQAVGCDIAFDEFRGEMMMAEMRNQWRPVADADTVRFRIKLEALGFKGLIGKEMMRDALAVVGDENTFDSAQLWLTEVVPEWDGVARIHRFYPDYLQTKDTPYTRALGNYIWTAHAGRVFDPGCQVDMVPVLVGDEGLRKTSALKAMAPAEDFYGEFNLKQEDNELSRIMRGKLVGELAELRGVTSRDGESIKAWITRTAEEWVPKYKEYAIKLLRRVVFQGTVNDDDFLQPHMGERRWAPVTVLRQIDTDKIRRDRDQLWAEAREVYQLDGIAWATAERLARAERDEYRSVDAWESKVFAWLDDAQDIDDGATPRTCGHLRTEDVLAQCLSISADKVKKADQMRVAAILKKAGMVRVQGWMGERNVKVWVDQSAAPSSDRRVAW